LVYNIIDAIGNIQTTTRAKSLGLTHFSNPFCCAATTTSGIGLDFAQQRVQASSSSAINKPNAGLLIKCFHGEQAGVDLFDARFLQTSLCEKYRIEKR